jgi:cell division protein FtsL
MTSQAQNLSTATKEFITTSVKGFFYKYVATMVVTLLLTFGASIFTAHANYISLEATVSENSAKIQELRSSSIRTLAREERLYEQLHQLDVAVASLKIQVIALRRDISHMEDR